VAALAAARRATILATEAEEDVATIALVALGEIPAIALAALRSWHSPGAHA
jgi:hypothetical protein